MALAELNARLAEMNNRASVQLNLDKTFALLRSLKSGEIGIDDFIITENGWELALPIVVEGVIKAADEPVENVASDAA